MSGKERPVLVGAATVMGVVIAALMTTGCSQQNAVEERVAALEKRVQSLEAELKKRDESAGAAGKISAEVGAQPPAAVKSQASSEPPQPINLAELASKLAEEKKTQVLASRSSVKGTIADNATKEYVFLGTGNAPLLFTLEQPDIFMLKSTYLTPKVAC